MMSLAEKIAFILDRKAEFARAGGTRKTTATAKPKGVATTSSAAIIRCCKGPGGVFAPGNNYAYKGGAKTAQRAAATRVSERLAAKSTAAQLDRAARQASVRVEATRTGASPASAIVARSAKAATQVARAKAAQDRAALEKRQAKNAKAREARAEKKAASTPTATAPATKPATTKATAPATKPASTPADRAAAVKRMTDRSRVASGKAGAENAARTRAAAEKAASSAPKPVAPVKPPPASVERRPITDPVRVKAEVRKVDEAFARIPNATRDNQASLTDLRAALPHLSRDEFDALVTKELAGGKYEVYGHGGEQRSLPERVKAGAIRVPGRDRDEFKLLAYIARRDV